MITFPSTDIIVVEDVFGLQVCEILDFKLEAVGNCGGIYNPDYIRAVYTCDLEQQSRI
jgi:hypothetical protein